MDFTLEEATQILERTPTTLRLLVEGLSAGWTSNNEGPDTWSPRDVVAHLIHGEEDDWIPRARNILQHGEAVPFKPFDRFAFAERYKGKSPAELLDTFEDLRRQNLEALAAMSLGPEQLKLYGTHPAFGRVTMAQLLATWAVHDLSHIVQITRVMAKQYDRAVGPWKAYLSVLSK